MKSVSMILILMLTPTVQSQSPEEQSYSAAWDAWLAAEMDVMDAETRAAECDEAAASRDAAAALSDDLWLTRQTAETIYNNWTEKSTLTHYEAFANYDDASFAWLENNALILDSQDIIDDIHNNGGHDVAALVAIAEATYAEYLVAQAVYEVWLSMQDIPDNDLSNAAL
tara:strand:+ start:1875 stop:2381 length:507 start_codon:yes stop_codon:yes gene_type:complete